MKQRIEQYIATLVVISCTLPLHTSVAFTQERQPIRVGLPAQEGSTMRSEDGSYSSYIYDYLLEIIQYTGWTYKFMEPEGTLGEQLAEILPMLENGELDIPGTIEYSEQLIGIHSFPSGDCDSAYYAAAVRNGEDRIDEYNLSGYRGLRIALLEQAKDSNEKPFQYTKLNSIDYKTVWCEDGDELYEKVLSGEADVPIGRDLSLKGGFRSITKYSPNPLFFAVVKGKTKIISELNQAITYISGINSMLQANLYDKYFSKTNGQLTLNSQEKTYIQENPTLKAPAHGGFGSFQYCDENEEIHGTAKNLLNDIADKAGWSLEYIYSDTYAGFEDSVLRNEANLILFVPHDYNAALREDVLSGVPYLETEVVLVTRDGVSVSDLGNRQLAVYKGKEKNYEKSEYVSYHDSIEGSLNAVEQGEYDYTYVNSYAASFYQGKSRHSRTIIYPLPTKNSTKYCLRILNKDNKLLSAILSEGANTVDANELEHYTYNSAQQNLGATFQAFVKDNPMTSIGGVLFIAICLIPLLSNHYRSQLKMKEQLRPEDTRYRYLPGILKEVTFTCDYERDCLGLSQEGVRIFEAGGHIEHYSRYHQNTDSDISPPALMALSKQKKDLDMELWLKFSGAEPEWFRIVIEIVMNDKKAVPAIERMQNIHAEKLEEG